MLSSSIRKAQLEGAIQSISVGSQVTALKSIQAKARAARCRVGATGAAAPRQRLEGESAEPPRCERERHATRPSRAALLQVNAGGRLSRLPRGPGRTRTRAGQVQHPHPPRTLAMAGGQSAAVRLWALILCCDTRPRGWTGSAVTRHARRDRDSEPRHTATAQGGARPGERAAAPQEWWGLDGECPRCAPRPFAWSRRRMCFDCGAST